MRKQLFFALSLLFATAFSFSGRAQILNIEQFRLDADTSHALLGNVSLGGSFTKQNNSIWQVGLGANAVYLSKKHSYMVLSDYSLLKSDKSDVENEGHVHFRINQWRRKKVSVEYFGQVQFDLGRGLESRQLGGAGVRFLIYNSKNDRLNISGNTTLMYEREIWEGDSTGNIESTLLDNGSLRTNFLKSSTNLTVRAKPFKNVMLELISYYQARPDDFFKPRFISDFSATFQFNKKLGLALNFSSIYDSAPVVDIEKLNYDTSMELVYNF